MDQITDHQGESRRPGLQVPELRAVLRGEAQTVPLVLWEDAYLALDVAAAASSRTAGAKATDLRRWVSAYESAELDGHPLRPVYQWTPPLTRRYLSRFNPPLRHRSLSTLRTFARFIERHRPRSFPAGDPTAGISWPRLPEPEWKGLSPDQVQRLRHAALLRIAEADRHRRRSGTVPKHRHAVRDRAILEVMLGAALRVSELCSLDLVQFEERHLVDVARKGGRLHTVYLPARARDALAEYLAVRGGRRGPLFLSRTRRRLGRTSVTWALQAIAEHAGAPPIHVYPHLLRHTALRAVAEQGSIQAALRLSGHSPTSGTRYIARYVSTTQEDLERVQESIAWVHQ